MIMFHGTNITFLNFDVSQIRPFNIGLHFGSRAAANARIDFLRECGESGPFSILECRLNIKHPFRVEDVFGHSYAMILDALQNEVNRCRTSQLSFRQEIEALIEEYMGIEDDSRFANDGWMYSSYYHRLNNDVVSIFRKLGYDGLVYKNEIEGKNSCADSYVAFEERQAMIIKRYEVAA